MSKPHSIIDWSNERCYDGDSVLLLNDDTREHEYHGTLRNTNSKWWVDSADNAVVKTSIPVYGGYRIRRTVYAYLAYIAIALAPLELPVLVLLEIYSHLPYRQQTYGKQWEIARLVQRKLQEKQGIHWD